MYKIVFYLMNEKGYFVLKNFLHEFRSDNIAYIVLSEDKAIEKDYYSEMVELCDSNDIHWYNRNDKIPNHFGYKFAIGWRWIISDNKNLIVLHDSLLPKYRGFSPLVNMLINGENEIGVTALFASKEYDKGPIILQEKASIDYPIKIKDAINIISPLYYRIIREIVSLIIEGGQLKVIIQDEGLASYSLWRDNKDYYIDWNKSSQYIRRMVDAVGYPYLGARTIYENNIILIDEVTEYEDLHIENRDVGKVIFFDQSCPIVVCGEGLIKIVKARFLNGESVLPLKKFRVRFGESK